MLLLLEILSIPLVFAGLQQVNTKQGLLEGVSQDKTFAFLGVHYGRDTAETGVFYAPEPVKPWEGLRKANKPAKSCFGDLDFTWPEFRGSERWNTPTNFSTDCLNLNIWVPKVASGPLPVLVWIFGGGFSSGSPSLDLYDGGVLAASTDVIVVALNYRLGPFGFLAFDFAFQPEVTGNVGLKDQTLALQWIHANIGAFGGDPKRITLFGESAGAVAVNYHAIRNKHLIRAAILQSGSIFAPWALTRRHSVSQIAKKMAEDLDCFDRLKPERNTTAILNCIISGADMKGILKAANKAKYSMEEFLGIGLGPILEESSVKEENFLQEFLRNQMMSNDQPLLIGWNRDEGSFLLPYSFQKYFNFEPEAPKVPELSFERYYRVVERIMQKYYPKSEDLYKIAMQYVNNPGKSSQRSYREAVIGLMSDYSFICPARAMIEILLKQGRTVYQYYYTYNADGNPWPDWMGVLHGEEIPMIFGDPLKQPKFYSTQDAKVSEKMMEFWANFAKDGKLPISGRVPDEAIEINEKGFVPRTNLPHHCGFFDTLDSSHACKKYPHLWLCNHTISTELPPTSQTIPFSPSSQPLIETTTTKVNTKTTTTRVISKTTTTTIETTQLDSISLEPSAVSSNCLLLSLSIRVALFPLALLLCDLLLYY